MKAVQKYFNAHGVFCFSTLVLQNIIFLNINDLSWSFSRKKELL